MDLWVGLGSFTARDWFDDLWGWGLCLLLLLLLLDEESAADFEGAWHV